MCCYGGSFVDDVGGKYDVEVGLFFGCVGFGDYCGDKVVCFWIYDVGGFY